jgi:hypothetical protein
MPSSRLSRMLAVLTCGTPKCHGRGWYTEHLQRSCPCLVQVFRDDLAIHPGAGRSIAGMAKSLRELGRQKASPPAVEPPCAERPPVVAGMHHVCTADAWALAQWSAALCCSRE